MPGEVSSYSGLLRNPGDRPTSRPRERPTGRVDYNTGEPLGRLPTSDTTKAEEEAIAALLDLSDEKGRVQLEAYMLSLEIERVSGALPPAGGGRRSRMRGGGPVANAAFKWLMGKINSAKDMVVGSAAAGAPDTTAAFAELAQALGAAPEGARKSVDATAARAVRATIPAVSTLGSLAPAAVGLAGASYLSNHPSLVVGVGDLAARMSLSLGTNLGALGPQWPQFISEMKSIGGLVRGAVATAAITIADRPYLIAAISYVLLSEYAKTTPSGSAYGLLVKSSRDLVDNMKSLAGRAASGVKTMAASTASSATSLAGDIGNVLSEQTMKGFYEWLDQHHIPAYDDLTSLRGDIQKAIAERTRAAAEAALMTAREGRVKAREAKAAAAAEASAVASAVAPQAPGPPGEGAAEQGAAGQGSVGMQQGGQGRRLTSRRRRHRVSVPRRTRRSSSGRRRGGSRRRRE